MVNLLVEKRLLGMCPEIRTGVLDVASRLRFLGPCDAPALRVHELAANRAACAPSLAGFALVELAIGAIAAGMVSTK
jgi:hypothetical protein